MERSGSAPAVDPSSCGSMLAGAPCQEYALEGMKKPGRILRKLTKENSNASVAYLLSGKCVLSRGQARACDAYHGPLRGRRPAWFYASIVFHELPRNSFFVGGKATNDFVRIWIDQIARATAPVRRAWWLERVNTALNAFARERGYRWEVHIDETPIDFWTIQGMKPPDPDSEAEKHWVKEDRPSAYS